MKQWLLERQCGLLGCFYIRVFLGRVKRANPVLVVGFDWQRITGIVNSRGKRFSLPSLKCQVCPLFDFIYDRFYPFVSSVPESGHWHNFLNFLFRATTLHGGRNQEQRWGLDVTSSWYFFVMVVNCLSLNLARHRECRKLRKLGYWTDERMFQWNSRKFCTPVLTFFKWRCDRRSVSCNLSNYK